MSKKKSYEKSYQRLQEILELLESDSVGIDELGSLIKEASVLVKECREKLRTIEEDIDNATKSE